jgi:hypothetical protein
MGCCRARPCALKVLFHVQPKSARASAVSTTRVFPCLPLAVLGTGLDGLRGVCPDCSGYACFFNTGCRTVVAMLRLPPQLKSKRPRETVTMVGRVMAFASCASPSGDGILEYKRKEYCMTCTPYIHRHQLSSGAAKGTRHHVSMRCAP